jgi:mono/diheme cytochrome c family protein
MLSKSILNFLLLLSLLFFAACSSVPVDPVSQPIEQRYISRGKSLAHGLAACGSCHGLTSSPDAKLYGRVLIDGDGNEIRTPSLAFGSQRDVSTNYLLAVLKGSALDDPDLFTPWAHQGFEWLSQEDALSLVSYIKLLEAETEFETASTQRDNPEFIEDALRTTGYVPQLNKSSGLAYGKYLVDHAARCQSCHNSEAGTFTDEGYLEGGIKFYKGDIEAEVPKLKGRFSNWSENQIVNYLVSGTKPDGKSISPEYCPTNFYGRADSEDLLAMAKYLTSLAGD